MKKSVLQFSIVFVLVPLLCFTFGCKQQVPIGLTDEEAKAIIDQVLQIWNEGKLALAEEVYSPDVIVKASAFPEEMVGHEAISGWVLSTRTGFPDFRMSFDEMIVKGETIVTIWSAKGTHTGVLSSASGDLPPTGKEFNILGIAINKVKNGKIVSELVVYNVLDMMQQLGFAITPPSMESEQ